MLRFTTYSSGDWNNTTLRPYTSGTRWYIVAPSGLIPLGINVSGSYNSGYEIDATSLSNTNAGDNSGWLFTTDIFINTTLDNLILTDYSPDTSFVHKPIPLIIYDDLISRFGSIASTQTYDLALATYPLINTYIISENGNANNMQSFDNTLYITIKAYDKLDAESDNSKYDITDKLFSLLESIKAIINTSDKALEYKITSSKLMGNSNDVLMPKCLEINLISNYIQDSIQTWKGAYV